MKVYELIGKLAKFPREQEVIVLNEGFILDVRGVDDCLINNDDPYTPRLFEVDEDTQGFEVRHVVYVSAS